MVTREDRQLRIGIVAVGGLAIVTGPLLFLAGWAGLWAWILLWAIVFVAAAVAFVVYARRTHRPALEDAPRAAAPDDGVHRVLVIADERCAPGELRDALVRDRDVPIEVFVVAPALGSRLARWTGDETAYGSAKERLDATLAVFAELDIHASGHIGPHDPLQAADDGLREFPAGEIVFATAPDGDANWLEDGVVEEARLRYGIAVTRIGGPR